MKKIRYFQNVKYLEGLKKEELQEAELVSRIFPFRANEYYASLIDWTSPDDPIKRIILPTTEEMEEWGQLDASRESRYTVAPGLQHKYPPTALLIVTDVCGAYCRFCFRKRLFMKHTDEVMRDIEPALEYIASHKEINNVLLTGGDPLTLSTRRLEYVIRTLRQMNHIYTIRIGSKIPAFNPYRLLNDPSLLEMLARYSRGDKRIYLVTHFNHPREITPEAVEAVEMVQKAGVVLANQTPLLRGINDDPVVLGELFNKLTRIGVAPYYVFQCRPTRGNHAFTLPVEFSLEVFEAARRNGSGLAKRARLIMSHETGKIEVLGKVNGQVIFRYYHQAGGAGPGGEEILVFNSNPEALWFDDYSEAQNVIMEKHRLMDRQESA